MAKRTSKSRKGLFLSFEGGEGGGKSTQIRMLAEWFKAKNREVVITREPGGSKLGERIREILLNPETKNLSLRSELLLYEADRAQHMEEVVKPALASGKVVISDRFSDSSTVYQGICRGFGVEWVEKLNTFATGGIFPDLVFVLDLPETEGLRRVHERLKSDVKLSGKRRRVKIGKLDRMEQEKSDFHKKVRKGFLFLAKRDPKRMRVVNAGQSIEKVSKDILSELESVWKK